MNHLGNVGQMEMQQVGFTEKEGNYIASRIDHFNNAIGVAKRVRKLYTVTYDPNTYEKTVEQNGLVEFIRELSTDYA